ncbi:cytochrome c oxidase assembly protein [Pontibacter ummariensis]|uniref:cytochrome c oxidase assembly protein n=1 Tax=Pontibacter ummariensis TaxID=1610492 RepID=UPI00215941C6|nr:cytochrome c oxidase assembly protein [Pontibacter ummariensis]
MASSYSGCSCCRLSCGGHQELRGHMVQHLLIGMFAPLFLVLGAACTITPVGQSCAGCHSCTKKQGISSTPPFTRPILFFIFIIVMMIRFQ